jgi:hypothetical protein
VCRLFLFAPHLSGLFFPFSLPSPSSPNRIVLPFPSSPLSLSPLSSVWFRFYLCGILSFVANFFPLSIFFFLDRLVASSLVRVRPSPAPKIATCSQPLACLRVATYFPPTVPPLELSIAHQIIRLLNSEKEKRERKELKKKEEEER